MTPHGDGDRLISTREVASLTGYSPHSIKRFKREGQLPGYVLIGTRGVRWWLSDILAWLEKQSKQAVVK